MNVSHTHPINSCSLLILIFCLLPVHWLAISRRLSRSPFFNYFLFLPYTDHFFFTYILILTRDVCRYCSSFTLRFILSHWVVFSAPYLTLLTDSLRDYSDICVMRFCQLRLYRNPNWWHGATCAIKKTRHGSCCSTCTGCRYRSLLHDSMCCRWDICFCCCFI